MKITKLYLDSSLDFNVLGWKRVYEYTTNDGIYTEKVIGKYIIAEGCEYIFGNIAAYGVSFDYSTVPEYDAVFLLGNPITYYKTFHPTYRVGEVGICNNNAEVIHVACDWLDIPVISLNIYFDEPKYRAKPLPSRNIFTGVNVAIVHKVLDSIAKHLNLSQDSKVLVYLAEPIFTSTSYEGKATKRIIKFLRNYK